MNKTVKKKIVMSVLAQDEPGIVRVLSDAVLQQQGNWLQSSLSRLAGQFAGIVIVEIPEANFDSFTGKLADMAARGIRVELQGETVASESASADKNLLAIIVEANDRPGIVDEISSALANKSVNIESMTTETESASMAGYELFIAELLVNLPADMHKDDLSEALECVSDDLMVSIVD